MKEYYNIIIIGSGPAGLGAAFYLIENNPKLRILIIDKNKYSSGGLMNDCKQNYTYPIGFTEELWNLSDASNYLEIVKNHLNPIIIENTNLSIYQERANKLNVKLLDIKQSHVGTDKSKILINNLISRLKKLGVDFLLGESVLYIFENSVKMSNVTNIGFDKVILATGRKDFDFLQEVMNSHNIKYTDNTLDVGIRIETKIENYSIVRDYYDPKFYFSNKVRTFCTNSGRAMVVPEQYKDFKIVNGHSLSDNKRNNGLVNFAILKTIGLQDPVRSGSQMGLYLARLANEIGGGKPISQRVGDFRIGKRSTEKTFNNDLYNFKPTYNTTKGDIGLAIPSKIMRDIWSALKQLDSIIPGVLHPSTIMYYPEIKYYANKPEFINNNFKVKENMYMVGDGAGTSRGITGAWASGIRAAKGVLNEFKGEIGGEPR